MIEEQTIVEDEVQDLANEEDKDSSTDLRYQIFSYGADYPVDALVKRMMKEDLILPKFQRAFVWPLTQCSRFIESLLLGLPVPAIFLSKEAESQKMMVIDGQQRLKSLMYFYDGILHGKEFKLSGVNKEFEGLTYKTLSEQDKRRLNDAIIHAIVIRQEDPEDDDSSVFLVFERLNTTSTPLSEQEIRACVYHGDFNDYLRDANKNMDWRKIFGGESPRQKDIELILRFFALYYNLAEYNRPMKLFLAKFMKKNQNLGLYSKETLDTVFISSVGLANRALGAKAFRPVRSLNASIVDAILVGTAKRLANGPLTDETGYTNAVNGVLADPSFVDLYQVGTTNKDRIEGRINRISAALADVK